MQAKEGGGVGGEETQILESLTAEFLCRQSSFTNMTVLIDTVN